MYYSYGKRDAHNFQKNKPILIFGKVLRYIANYHLHIEFE